MNLVRTIACGALAGAYLAPVTAEADAFKVSGLDAADAIEIKPFFEFETNRNETVLEGPGLDITLPVARDLEISTVFGSGHLHEKGGRGRWGLIDTEFAAKWAILPVPEAGGWGLATEPAIIAPTGTNGLGDDEWRVEVPLMLGWVSGPWELRGKLGYERGIKTGHDEVFVGGLIKYSVDETLSIGAEVVGNAERLGLATYEPTANIGLNWEFAAELELQARLGKSLHNENNTPTTSGKIAIEFAL